MNRLKYIRTAISLLFFVPILLFFLDFTGKLPLWLHGLLKIQWVTALLSLNVVIIGGLLLLSLFFGRIYCSTICPLGIFQDIASWKSRLFRAKKKKYHFKFAHQQRILRYSILAATVVVFVLGSSVLMVLFDPYSIFGRMVSQLFKPLVVFANNGMATLLIKAGNYTMYRVEQVSFVPLAFYLSFFFFGSIALMGWFRGRMFCNTVCPVGTSLGLLSKISVFRIHFKESSCTRCGLCEKACKAQCIDSKAMKVDETRCVSCFNCLSACKKSSMKYSFRYQKEPQKAVTEVENDLSQNSRRAFLQTSFTVAGTLTLANAQALTGKKDAFITRKPIMPPGAINVEHFNSKCTGCQLCVSKCPMHVLKPAVLQYGISGIMQPHLLFSTNVFCTFNCNICSTVCPTGALKQISLEEKKLVQIGVAKFRKEKCEVYVKEKDCGACAEHCPSQAVHMIPYKNGLTIPEVTENLCIGCGGCESICPIHPYPAIYVEGNTTQIKAVKPAEAEKFNKKVDDFGF